MPAWNSDHWSGSVVRRQSSSGLSFRGVRGIAIATLCVPSAILTSCSLQSALRLLTPPMTPNGPGTQDLEWR
ncbi:hypothetical protein K458DRAFT_13929 [Lentithecium fluviatile CBS 122367]|uniref:Uncharacterized protein n=1 Tax=Lentithecium fluviatile CBS 122367 TaxID=1168545 RepID=A0A6G1J5R4_9PLEO|nr:hypothetical protein K458DRAFT_13929 [Lentithecium fluviatile CBS 122367]